MLPKIEQMEYFIYSVKMNMQIVSESIYRPEYNAETKKYEDVNPIPRYKQGFRYRCMCHSTLIMTKSSDFTQHFKSKLHRDYVSNYERNTKDLTDANERIKYLQIKLELNHQTIRRLEQELYLLKKPYSYQTELD
jgi:hypothetical protein